MKIKDNNNNVLCCFFGVGDYGYSMYRPSLKRGFKTLCYRNWFAYNVRIVVDFFRVRFSRLYTYDAYSLRIKNMNLQPRNSMLSVTPYCHDVDLYTKNNCFRRYV